MAYTPVREDFLTKIIEVGWGRHYRLAGFILSQNGSPAYAAEFGPTYTEAELNTLAKNHQLLPIPEFGPRVPLPGEQHSQNGSYIFLQPSLSPPSFTIKIIGDALITYAPTGQPDAAGYSTMQCYNVGVATVPSGIPSTFPDPSVKIELDYNGSQLFGNVPTLPDKGWIITSDDEGPVFVRLDTSTAGPSTVLGVTKYDAQGQVLWTLDPPDTVRYDPATKRLALTYLRALPANRIEIRYFNLKGVRVKTTALPSSFQGNEVSRKGKIYAFGPEPDDTYAPILGFNNLGAQIWTIPGESSDDGFEYGSIAAYGEDYIVVTITKNLGIIDSGPFDAGRIGPGSFTTRSELRGYRIYDAHTGQMVREHMSADETTTFGADPLFGGVSATWLIGQASYGGQFGFIRSRYWP